jgi:predicted transcriptional regulator
MPHKAIHRLTTSTGGLERLLPEREAEAMRLFWRGGPQSVRQIYEEIRQHRDIAYTTVMTTCTRLADKGLLLRERDGGLGYIYTPTTDELGFVVHALAQVLDGVLGEYPYALEEYITGQAAR